MMPGLRVLRSIELDVCAADIERFHAALIRGVPPAVCGH